MYSSLPNVEREHPAAVSILDPLFRHGSDFGGTVDGLGLISAAKVGLSFGPAFADCLGRPLDFFGRGRVLVVVAIVVVVWFIHRPIRSRSLGAVIMRNGEQIRQSRDSVSLINR